MNEFCAPTSEVMDLMSPFLMLLMLGSVLAEEGERDRNQDRDPPGDDRGAQRRGSRTRTS